MPSRGLRFEDTRFWVIHRRREFGPFDYEWSPDLRGVELTYQGTKFGEICSEREIFADLRGFGLPLRVAEVASLTLGCLLYSILRGLTPTERGQFLRDRLTQHGCAEFFPTDPLS
jgi:hypothetical protein